MCIKKTNMNMILALISMNFRCFDYTENEELAFITEVIDHNTNKFLFVIILQLVSETLLIKITNISSDCNRILNLNIPEIFEITDVIKFCELRGIDEFRNFINDPLNNKRQL